MKIRGRSAPSPSGEVGRRSIRIRWAGSVRCFRRIFTNRVDARRVATGGPDTVFGNKDDDIIFGGIAGDVLKGDDGGDGNDVLLGDNAQIDFALDDDGISHRRSRSCSPLTRPN